MNWIWKRAIQKLNASSEQKLNLIDIGCHKGWFMSETYHIVTKPSYWIGIDACDYGVCQNMYNQFYNLAISDVKEPTVMEFNEYPEETGCNSLLKMNIDKITHNRDEYENKWYVERHIEIATRVRQVQVCSFYDLFKNHPVVSNGPLHFVKIDTQGNDINVAKSMGEFLKKTWFVQLECVTSKNPDIVMYAGQGLMEQNVSDMEKLGFGIYDYINYGANRNAPPEADVVFYNKSFVTQ